jgi:hypothetical protein
MASTDEPQAKEIDEDQESNDLFNAFMDITKEQDKKSMDDSVENDQEKGLESKEIKENDEWNFNNIVTPEEQRKEETVEATNEDKILSNDKELPDKNVHKRLSKAVDELSDLEQQLCLMISDNSTPGIQQENILNTTTIVENDNDGVKDDSGGDKTSTGNENKSQDAINELEETVLNIGGPTTGGDNSAAEQKSGDEEAFVVTLAVGDDEKTGITDIMTELKGDNTMTISSEENHKGTDEISQPQLSSCGVENEGIEHEEKLQSDVKSNEVLANGNDHESSPLDSSHTESLKQGDQEDAGQKNDEVDAKPDSSPDTITNSQKEVEQDGSVNGKLDSPIEDSSPEALDDNASKKSSSAPEIEILMTDESGISERKSLDSLDLDLDENNHSRPESPALSDEGIDLDSKSDAGDDDTFDTSSSDLSLKSKSSHLDVDRHRAGSDSSTVSEQEFKSDLPDKTDGVNEDTSGNSI